MDVGVYLTYTNVNNAGKVIASSDATRTKHCGTMKRGALKNRNIQDTPNIFSEESTTEDKARFTFKLLIIN